MYTKVVELEELYLVIENYFQIHRWVLTKLENTNFYYRKWIEMYGKCIIQTISIEFFKMMPPFDLNLIYIQVVEQVESYLCPENNFKIHGVGFEQTWK